MRRLLLLLALAAACRAAEPAREYVQAVEFPYYSFPRTLWERELVWLKTLGIRTVAFSIPWNWHQPRPGAYDLTGTTSPRRDLMTLIRVLRRLGMQAWIRPLPPVKGMVNAGWPAGAAQNAGAQRTWLRHLEQLLAPQTVKHGGPVAYVEGKALAIDAQAPPAPVTVVSANDSSALARSRRALASRRGALLWEEVEDIVFPAGWQADPSALVVKGAVGLDGIERWPTAALRRSAALLRGWAAFLPVLQAAPAPRARVGKLPPGVTAGFFASSSASALSVTNAGDNAVVQDLRIRRPGAGRSLVVPGISLPAGESLWLPISVSLGSGGLCRNCSNFSSAEHIIYATAELHAVEYENGILSMEFAAPAPGEVILQLARQPAGPYLAAGRLSQFDWDEKTLRARLPIPSGTGAGNRVRVGLAIEPPDASAFFSGPTRLLVGRTNAIATSYSSAEIAGRSRLRLPEGFTSKPIVKSPVEIDYEVEVPPTALHGDWVELALEADGVLMGRSRLQLLRPASVRWPDAIGLHLGPGTELPVEPPVAPADARTGRNIEIVIRNNSPTIQTYRVEATGEGLAFSPPAADISIGGALERSVSLRVFPDESAPGLREWRLRVTGGANVEMLMRLLLLPRGQTVAWSADLDGDGYPEWVLESQKTRAVFSAQDGGRWLDFTWKDTGTNFLPEGGALAGAGRVEVNASGSALEFSGRGWKRTVRLEDSKVVVEQTAPLAVQSVTPSGGDGVALTVIRESATRAVYSLD
jgi:hypothetical protein